jgi:hypothetical protein
MHWLFLAVSLWVLALMGPAGGPAEEAYDNGWMEMRELKDTLVESPIAALRVEPHRR